jgi:hypothetical protein
MSSNKKIKKSRYFSKEVFNSQNKCVSPGNFHKWMSTLAKLDADIRTSSSLGWVIVIQIVLHDYYPVALEDGGRLAPMAVELVDRLAILVVLRRLPSLGAADSRSLRSKCYTHMNDFVYGGLRMSPSVD